MTKCGICGHEISKKENKKVLIKVVKSSHSRSRREMAVCEKCYSDVTSIPSKELWDPFDYQRRYYGKRMDL